MAKNISEISINASAEKVWDALTKPALVKLWQYGSELKTTWLPGSEITFSTEWQGNVFKQWGSVIEVRPYELIRYNLFAPRPGLEDKTENYFIMEYLLKAENQHTHLTIIQEDNRPGAVQEPPQGEENEVLQALKKIAETQQEQ